jgi:hypothetical protein
MAMMAPGARTKRVMGEKVAYDVAARLDTEEENTEPPGPSLAA